MTVETKVLVILKRNFDSYIANCIGCGRDRLCAIKGKSDCALVNVESQVALLDTKLNDGGVKDPILATDSLPHHVHAPFCN